MDWVSSGNSRMLKNYVEYCTLTRTKVLNQCVLPILSYGAQTWSSRPQITKKVNGKAHDGHATKKRETNLMDSVENEGYLGTM